MPKRRIIPFCIDSAAGCPVSLGPFPDVALGESSDVRSTQIGIPTERNERRNRSPDFQIRWNVGIVLRPRITPSAGTHGGSATFMAEVCLYRQLIFSYLKYAIFVKEMQILFSERLQLAVYIQVITEKFYHPLPFNRLASVA